MSLYGWKDKSKDFIHITVVSQSLQILVKKGGKLLFFGLPRALPRSPRPPTARPYAHPHQHKTIPRTEMVISVVSCWTCSLASTTARLMSSMLKFMTSAVVAPSKRTRAT
jgi:hypothetical protein